MLGCGSLATLRKILGHSTVKVTERHGHLRADPFRPSDLLTLTVDLARPTGAVIDLAAHRDEAAGNHSAIMLVEEEAGRRVSADDSS